MSREGIPQRIAARRQARRRRLRRQRLAAGGLLLLVGALLVGFGIASDFRGSASPDLTIGGVETADADLTGSGTGDTGGAAPNADRGLRPAPLGNAKPGPDWRPHREPVPVLMYHVIEDPAPGAPYPDLYLTPADFRAQVEWLAAQGFEAVTLRQVERAWWHGGRLPEKPIVLSFDDGYVSHFEVAYPAMAEHGWPGLLNLKAGETDIYKRQVREMVAAGWELGSHTINHPDLTTLDTDALAEELERSRRVLRRSFGVPVTHFCYPAGRYDDRVVAAVEAAGYSTASTTDPGLASSEEPFRLKRIRIGRGDGPDALAAALAGAGL